MPPILLWKINWGNTTSISRFYDVFGASASLMPKVLKSFYFSHHLNLIKPALIQVLRCSGTARYAYRESNWDGNCFPEEFC